jgi:hypothetical protein
MQGQYAESTVPTAVADGDVVRPWFEEYGRPVIFGADLSSGAIAITPVSATPRSTFETADETLTDVGDQTTSKNVSEYPYISFQIVFASYESPAVFRILGSVDDTNFGALPLEDNDTTGSTDNLSVTGADATISAAGTYIITTKALAIKYVRLEWSDGGSPPAAAATVNMIAGS